MDTDSTSQFWEKYLEEAEEYDKDFLEKNRNNMESVLIFSGLFSAVAAGFLAGMQATLSPNPADTTNALLTMLVHSINNTTLPNQTSTIPPWEGPRSSDIWSQSIGYAGLSASLLAALGAMLGKQWLTDFTRLRRGPLQERGRRRQQKLDGLKKWQFEVVMGALPALIQLALLLFGIAVSIRLWQLNRAVGSVVIASTAVGGSLYLFFTIASLFSPSCPFHTPVSSTIQEAVAIIMRSLEETCQYWAWRTSDLVQKPLRISAVNKLLAYLPVLFALPLFVLASVSFAMISIACSPILLLIVVIWWLQVRPSRHHIEEDFNAFIHWFKRLVVASRRKFHCTACSVRDVVRRIRILIHTVYLNPQPDPGISYSSSIAWLLENSNHPDFVMAAAMVVPDTKWPEDLDLSLSSQHLCNMFICSISEKGDNAHALATWKAFVIMLCQESADVRPHVWLETLRGLQRAIGDLIDPNHDNDCDLPFIINVVTKLLYIRSNLDPLAIEFSTEHPVSLSLLTWFLQPLQILLQPGDPRRPHFFPEARLAILKLDWSEGTKLSVKQQVQYCRVFELYLDNLGGLPTERFESLRSADHVQDPMHEQVDIISRILIQLQRACNPLPQDAHRDLLVPLTVISTLSGVSHLKQAFERKGVELWALKAFTGAVHRATRTNDQSSWLLASALLQLASQKSDVDVSDPTKSRDQRSVTNRGMLLPSMSPSTVDFDSLLSYLLNKVGYVSAEQITYAFEIMLHDTDGLAAFVHRYYFINYVVNTTGPEQVYSIRDTGLKVLFASCDSLLRSYGQPENLLSLAKYCNLARFIHRAVLYQDPPSILIYLLHENNDALNEVLSRILSPSLGDPFTVLQDKLRTEPNRIPERDLRGFEITLILAKTSQKKFTNYLDRHIKTIPESDIHMMALALTVVVGWLLRPGGPASSSPSLKQQLLRPGIERLLVPAWGDPDVLEESPQMLRQLLTCTEEWLTTCQSPLPLRVFDDLEKALVDLSSNTRMLSVDIKRSLQKASREIQDLRVAEEHHACR